MLASAYIAGRSNVSLIFNDKIKTAFQVAFHPINSVENFLRSKMASKEDSDEYEQRYCAFIDFLGFAGAVEKGLWTPADIVSAMNKAARVTKSDQLSTQVTQFSDSVVLSAPIDDPWAFETITSTAFFLIIELANHGILLRGGITKGLLYHRENIAFGPAFIRAYRLEQAANTPRIIIDTGIAEAASWPDSMDETEIAGVFNRSIPEDFDGWRYVDYLSPHHVGEFDNGSDGLAKHYASLRAMVENARDSKVPSIRSKYGWLEKKLLEVGQ